MLSLGAGCGPGDDTDSADRTTVVDARPAVTADSAEADRPATVSSSPIDEQPSGEPTTTGTTTGRAGASPQDEVADMIINEIESQGALADEGCVRVATGRLSDEDAEAIVAAGPDGDPDVSVDAERIASEVLDCADLSPFVDQAIDDMVAELGAENVDEDCLRDAFDDADLTDLDLDQGALAAVMLDCITIDVADPAPDDAASFNVGLTYDVGGRGDQSFNDSAAAGIERAAAELGISYTEEQPDATGSNRADVLQAQADRSDLVIGVGFLFFDDVATVARTNPGTNFAVLDDAMLDFAVDPPAPICPNCAGLTFAEEEGSFLVGVAAALNSETGTVGFLGGVSGFGLIEKFEAGFAAGVRAVDPGITVISEYVTQAPDFEGFVAPSRARQIALGMYSQGADVIYHSAGASGAGLFEAAAEHSGSSGSKVWAIGVDSDQYLTAAPEVREYILTSMVKRIDNAAFSVAAAQLAGTFQAGNTIFTLADGGLDYSTSGGFLTDDQIAAIESFRVRIIDGGIDVPTAPR